MKSRSTARDAYVRAEVATSLARQIRAIRLQRDWTQAELASKMGTTQAVVSRLEDPSYGRLSIKTLLDLAQVFDAGLRVQFVSLVSMLHETFKPKAELRAVPAFTDEAPWVDFYSPTKRMAESISIQPSSVMMLTNEAMAPERMHSVVLRFNGGRAAPLYSFDDAAEASS